MHLGFDEMRNPNLISTLDTVLLEY